MKKKKKISIKFLKKVKIRKYLMNFMYVLVCILVLLHLIILINTTLSKQDYFNLFGFTMVSMPDNMMSPKINKNDLVISTNYDKNVKENDLICYYNNGKIIVSEVINEIQTDGKKKYITKLNNAYYPSVEEIVEEQIIGKVQKTIPVLGIFFDILKSKITTGIVVILLILKFSYNKYMYKQMRRRKGKIILYK